MREITFCCFSTLTHRLLKIYSKHAAMSIGKNRKSLGFTKSLQKCKKSHHIVSRRQIKGPCRAESRSRGGRNERIIQQTAGWTDNGRRCQAAGRRCSCLRSRDALPARWQPRQQHRKRCPPERLPCGRSGGRWQRRRHFRR